MGSWACFCALCSGPLQDYRRLRREDGDESDSECHSYDPELLGELDWLDKVRCLCVNAGLKESYISGYSYETDQGRMRIPVGDDTNETYEKQAYYEYEEGDGWVFPFHDMCYEILTDIIINSSYSNDRKTVDKFVLFQALSRFVERDTSVSLGLDCAGVAGAEQFWQEYEGDEYTVAKPALLPDVQAAIVSKISDRSLALQELSQIPSAQRTTSDPFLTLSHDAMFHLARFLSAKDVLALSTASWPFLVATASSTVLWKSLLHWEMAWAADKLDQCIGISFKEDEQEKKQGQLNAASERDGESCELKAQEVDYKALMLWLDHVVKPYNGVGAPWLHLANRRRIWRVCQVVANKYWDELGKIRGRDYEDRMQFWPDSLLGEKYQRVFWGSDVTVASSDGWTPLYSASCNGHREIVKILLEKGADMTVTGKDGRTPLNAASDSGHVEVVKLLLEKGADMTVTDEDGWTPLNSASRNGHVEVAKLLLEKGADMTVANHYGSTPLDSASWNGHVKVVTLLLEKGADMTGFVGTSTSFSRLRLFSAAQRAMSWPY